MKLADSNTFTFSATDLSNYLACHHLTQLSRKVALKEISRPKWQDPSLAILIERGQAHEAAYLQSLKEQGLRVKKLNWDSAEASLQAMRDGYDVIAQARLELGQWMGYADILRKVNKPSSLGNWSYEVMDTKLTQNTKATSILQLCLYSDLLTTMQGLAPEKMYIVKPGEPFETECYRYEDFHAYYRYTKRSFENTLFQSPTTTYPEPCEHCSICDWWKICDIKREADDHLSLVAGIRSGQVDELIEQGISTLATFAEAAEIKKPSRGSFDSLLQKQAQAKLQLRGRIQNTLLHETFPINKGFGLARLPKPNPGDIYFDIEGDPFYPDGGIEYLLGYVYHDTKNWVYEKIWSQNRKQERDAFQRFMTFVMDRWKRYPNMYIYHFAPYEPSAVKRLARVHATFEVEADRLIRAERFIDLHTVFKEGLLASVRRYSLKELEKVTPYLRQVPLPEASLARKHVEVSLEAGDFDSFLEETKVIVEKYNEDDCLATQALHLWLESLRNELISANDSESFRPELKTGEATEEVKDFETRAAAIRDALLEQLPADPGLWTEEDEARWLLAHQVEYFRREDKTAWWEYYRVHELDHDDLLDERKAITGLRFVEILPPKGKDRLPSHRYEFPEQEVDVDEDDEAIEVRGEKVGTISAIDLERRTVDIKKMTKALEIHPSAIHVHDRIDPKILTNSLLAFANEVCDTGFDKQWGYGAAKDLLLKKPPQLQNGVELSKLYDAKKPIESSIAIARLLDKSVLPVQGPPGAGKTFLGGKMILELAKAGKKIGVTAVSHKVIRNLLEKVHEFSTEENYTLPLLHKVKKDDLPPSAGITESDDNKKALKALEVNAIVGGTAWLWASDDAAGKLDYLFVDEAGQMSLSTVLAAARSARNVILLGDPQQLEQPQRGAHPEGSDIAALTHLLDGHQTIPPDRGVFLGTTYRLHPFICKFTSELFYENRLESLPGLSNQLISGGTKFDGAGLFYVPVTHHGNQSRSDEEVAVIVSLVNELLKRGKWTDQKGNTRALTAADVLLITPYNAQVAALKEALPHLRVGTVDKFQGQEAPVVIYSMATSSAEDAPRGMSFLYNPNRLNVATSRAKSVCILVASPLLMEPGCNSIDQMRWANGLCRYREMAKSFL